MLLLVVPLRCACNLATYSRNEQDGLWWGDRGMGCMGRVCVGGGAQDELLKLCLFVSYRCIWFCNCCMAVQCFLYLQLHYDIFKKCSCACPVQPVVAQPILVAHLAACMTYIMCLMLKYVFIAIIMHTQSSNSKHKLKAQIKAETYYTHHLHTFFKRSDLQPI